MIIELCYQTLGGFKTLQEFPIIIQDKIVFLEK